MEHQAPSLVTLTANILQHVAARLDGHSLLALLSTCRDLHDSPALRASLFEAVLHQLGALEAAQQVILQTTSEAEALLDCTESVWHAHQQLVPGLPKELTLAPARVMVTQEAADTKRSAVEALQQARAAVIAAKAAGQPGQQPQAAWQELGRIVVQARHGALQALQLEGEGESLGARALQVVAAAEQGLQQAVQALQQASQKVPEEQLQLKAALQVLQQEAEAMHQPEVWGAMQQAMQEGQQALQAGPEVDEEAQLAVLQAVAVVMRPAGLQQLQRLQDILQPHHNTFLLPLGFEHWAVGLEALLAIQTAIQTALEQFKAMINVLGSLHMLLLQQKQQVQKAMLRLAGRQLLGGRPQVDQVEQRLTAVVQERAQDLKHQAWVLLQRSVTSDEDFLQQADGNVPLGVLRVAVQAGQAMLQGLE